GSVTVENERGEAVHEIRLLQGLPGRTARILTLNCEFTPTPLVSEAELLTQLRRVRGDIDWLYVRSIPVTDAGLSQFSRIPSLARLGRIGLVDTKIRDEGISNLNMFRTIKILEIEKVKFTEKGIRHLRSLPELRGLLLGSCGLTDPALAEL